jgi:hypothetical protein
MSKAFNKEEQIYCVTRKELLAVVSALKNFHSYLNGQEVILLILIDFAQDIWYYLCPDYELWPLSDRVVHYPY